MLLFVRALPKQMHLTCMMTFTIPLRKTKKRGKQFLFQSDMNNEDETTHITTFALHLDGAIPISLGLSWPLTYFLPPFGSGVAPSTFTFKPLFDFEPYLGKIPILTHIFQIGASTTN